MDCSGGKVTVDAQRTATLSTDTPHESEPDTWDLPDSMTEEAPLPQAAAPAPAHKRRLRLPSRDTALAVVIAIAATIGAGTLAAHFQPTPSPANVVTAQPGAPLAEVPSAAIPAETFEALPPEAMPPVDAALPALPAPAPAPAPQPLAQEFAQQATIARPFAVSPIYTGILTSGFGPRWGEMHNGIDIAANMGAPVLAVTDGTVVESGPAQGFGLWIRIRQDDGTIGVYGHMEHLFVLAGERVQAGQIIATVGSRGQSTGPHLHYEVRRTDGVPLNPLQWLASRGVWVS
jgi:murein DD-endopeptidase MepM/ murein hydrolase activator NlpD